MRRKTYKFVRVAWADASFHDNRMEIKDAIADACLIEVYTVGYLLERSRDKLVISSEINEFGVCRQINAIPRSCVRQIEYLERKNVK